MKFSRLKNFFHLNDLTGCEKLLLATIFFAWLGVRLFNRPFWFYSDMPDYVELALLLGRGKISLSSLLVDHPQMMRFGVFYPFLFFLKIFGNHEFTLQVWPLICSFLALVTTFSMGTLLFNKKIGLVAAILYTVHPADIVFSTIFLPDPIVTGLMNVAMYFALKWSVEKGSRFVLLTSVIFLVITYFTRIDFVIMFPAYLLCLFVKKDSLPEIKNIGKLIIKIALVIIAIFILEGVFYKIQSGNFFKRIDALYNIYISPPLVPDPKQRSLSMEFSLMPNSLFGILKVPGIIPTKSLIKWEDVYNGFLFVFTFAGLLIFLVRKLILYFRKSEKFLNSTSMPFIFILFWLLFPVLYRQFGTQSWSGYIPIHRLSRHFLTFSPAACLISAVLFCMCWDYFSESRFPKAKFIRNISTLLLALVFLASSFVGIREFNRFYFPPNGQVAAVERLIDKLKDYKGEIRGEWKHYRPMEYYLNGLDSKSVNIQSLNLTTHCDEFKGGVVFFNSSDYWWDRMVYKRRLLERLPCLENPPENWEEIETGGPEKLYRIK